MATEETLASWLRRQLTRRDWKYGDLAERAEVSTASISRWVNGKELPSSENAIKLADALDADTDHILVLAGHRPRMEPIPPDDPLSRLIRKLKRVQLNRDRENLLDQIIDTYLETDRESHNNLLVHAA